MTELLEMVIDRARALSPSSQDAFARAMLLLLDDRQGSVELSEDERRSFAGSLEQAARGEFAPDDRVTAIWAKHGL